MLVLAPRTPDEFGCRGAARRGDQAPEWKDVQKIFRGHMQVARYMDKFTVTTYILRTITWASLQCF